MPRYGGQAVVFPPIAGRDRRARMSAALLAAACSKSSPPPPEVTPPSGAETINGTERLGWTQRAADAVELATVRYAIYVDGTRSELAGASCAADRRRGRLRVQRATADADRRSAHARARVVYHRRLAPRERAVGSAQSHGRRPGRIRRENRRGTARVEIRRHRDPAPVSRRRHASRRRTGGRRLEPVRRTWRSRQTVASSSLSATPPFAL